MDLKENAAAVETAAEQMRTIISGNQNSSKPKSSAIAERAVLVQYQKGRALQSFSMTPPVVSASNHIPPRNEPREIIREQSPGADFSLNKEPKRSPNDINITADGIVDITAAISPEILRELLVISAMTNDAEKATAA